MRKKGFKFFCFFVQLLLIILTFLLIPLNLFVVNFPAWIVVLCGVLALACMTVYLILFRTKLVTKIVLPLFAVLVTGFSSVLAYCCPYWDSYSFKSVDTVWLNFDEELTFEQAEEDLLAAMRHLEQVHPMFRDGLTQEIKERYDASLASLRQMQTITVNDLRRAVQIILHPMHDAHTTTYNSWPEDRYLMDLLEKRRLGYGVYSINGRTVGEIITAAAPYYCYESEAWINVDLASLASLRFYEYEEPFTYVWENEAGDCVTEHYTAADFVTWEEFEAMSQFYDGDVAEEPPSEEMEEPFVYYEIDVEHSLAVLTLKECNYNDEYRQCVHEMFQEVREKQIQNVAVDVRGWTRQCDTISWWKSASEFRCSEAKTMPHRRNRQLRLQTARPQYTQVRCPVRSWQNPSPRKTNRCPSARKVCRQKADPYFVYYSPIGHERQKQMLPTASHRACHDTSPLADSGSVHSRPANPRRRFHVRQLPHGK